MIKKSDSLEYLKSKKDFEFDMNYSDPPYALGSEVIIKQNGKVDYKKASDFMNKWEMPTGAYWEEWFKEAFRTLKYGGYLIMFGMDRQLLLFKYYANLAGFTEQQSLYWYFISSFPKATDLSKQIDKNAGAEREVVGNLKTNVALYKEIGNGSKSGNVNITSPSTDLAKKYEGYKYSISPLKQTNETIMVFKKPYKKKSCLLDTLAYENGDKECRCGALNIDGNRVGTDTINQRMATVEGGKAIGGKGVGIKQKQTGEITTTTGRYPPQTFVDSDATKLLDEQSGKIKSVSGGTRGVNNGKSVINFGKMNNYNRGGFDDTGGCSKILNKCDYEKGEMDLYIYNPKVSKKERNAGCDGIEEKPHNTRKENGKSIVEVSNKMMKNNHPTLKPIKLNDKILSLFKTPNEDEKIIYSFAGAGSEIIGGIKAGFKNWCGCEINQEYVDIANARIEYWKDRGYEEIEVEEKKEIEQLKLF